MELHTHFCAECEAQFHNGNAMIVPPGWEWRGSRLLCDDCLAPKSAPLRKATAPRTDSKGTLWQIECQFKDNHRLARPRTLTVSASNPVEAYEKVKPNLAPHAADLASFEVTPAPLRPSASMAEGRLAA
jgi:hypothetical protein